MPARESRVKSITSTFSPAAIYNIAVWRKFSALAQGEPTTTTTTRAKRRDPAHIKRYTKHIIMYSGRFFTHKNIRHTQHTERERAKGAKLDEKMKAVCLRFSKHHNAFFFCSPHSSPIAPRTVP
jgi:hypothetical protein